jgi:chemotaxis signal transduction protein
VSNGYREFKVTDGYKEDVIAVVYDAFGEVRNHFSSGNDSASIIQSDSTQSSDPEFATFFVDETLFALEAEIVLEALSASEISSVSIGSRSERVGVIAVQHEGKGKNYVWVYDLSYLLSGVPSVVDSNSQVIVIMCGQHKIGLLVGALHSVAQFNQTQISMTPLANDKRGNLIKWIIKANEGNLFIQCVDVDFLLRMLTNPFDPVKQQ